MPRPRRCPPITLGVQVAIGGQVQLASSGQIRLSADNLFAQTIEGRDVGFQRVRPWGKHGDRKNDGWSPSRRIMLQCNAPSTFTTAR